MVRITRRELLRAGLAGLAGLAAGVSVASMAKADEANANYEKLDAVLARPVFKRELFPEPVLIESVDLLRYGGSFLCRVRSNCGAEGISVAHGTMRLLYPDLPKAR